MQPRRFIGLRFEQEAATTVQLSVPVIAAVGGAVLLGEPLTPRIVASSFAILVGIGLVTAGTERAAG